MLDKASEARSMQHETLGIPRKKVGMTVRRYVDKLTLRATPLGTVPVIALVCVRSSSLGECVDGLNRYTATQF